MGGGGTTYGGNTMNMGNILSSLFGGGGYGLFGNQPMNYGYSSYAQPSYGYGYSQPSMYRPYTYQQQPVQAYQPTQTFQQPQQTQPRRTQGGILGGSYIIPPKTQTQPTQIPTQQSQVQAPAGEPPAGMRINPYGPLGYFSPRDPNAPAYI